MIRVVSGGQTGVDRAALDAAISAGVPHGGWCPMGRLSEDGKIPADYNLKESTSSNYPQRTERNVRDSDATLIITAGKPTGGTAFTIECARRLGRPYLVVDPDDEKAAGQAAAWIDSNNIAVLNVAGPRKSTMPGMYAKALSVITALLSR